LALFVFYFDFDGWVIFFAEVAGEYSAGDYVAFVVAGRFLWFLGVFSRFFFCFEDSYAQWLRVLFS
jgi:hypothetical protein